MPPISHGGEAFARTGQPSYAGITNETYVGTDRREPGTITLEGDWRSGRQYVELRKGTGKIVVPFTAGEVNLVMQPGASGMRRSPCCSMGSRSAKPAERTSARMVWRASTARGCFDWLPARPRRRHVLTLVATDPGVRAFVFTFGP